VTLKFHPLAVDLFPPMDDAEFEALVADIKAHGLREPVVMFEDMILDGRHRYRACQSAGIEPTFTVYTGDDPVSYVISLNLRRRHLDESQRAMVAAKLATMKQGTRTDLSPIGEMSQAQAADLLNVGKRSVERAGEVLDHGTPGLVQAVERGDVSVSAAAEVASLPEPEQRETLAGGDKAVKAKAKDLRAGRAKRSAAAQKARETRLRKRQAELEASRRKREAEEGVKRREMGELASKLIALDRDIARAILEALHDKYFMFEDALEEGLNRAPDGTHDRWIEGDSLDGSEAA
jgi:ParB-like chromosome segregation protein Spo0J